MASSEANGKPQAATWGFLVSTRCSLYLHGLRSERSSANNARSSETFSMMMTNMLSNEAPSFSRLHLLRGLARECYWQLTVLLDKAGV